MTEQQRRDIIVETVKAFRAKQWFRDVTIYDSHPNTGEPTMELKVIQIWNFNIINIKPVFIWASSSYNYIISECRS